MRKVYFAIILLLVVLLSNSTVFAAPLNLTQSGSYILIDAKTGQVILEYNADKKFRPASTTKIMTAILALEKGDLNAVMKVSKEAVYDIGEGGMNIGIMPDESNLTLETLLNAMLIKSANETANIIAENIGGSKSAFVDMMNNRAAELGAKNTHFVNPCGKDDAKEDAAHLSTARDMAVLARYAITIPKFREIVCKEYYNDMPATNKHEKWSTLRTSNKLLWDNNNYPYTLDGIEYNYTVNGIKTGYTSAAGNNLISSAVDKDGMQLIAAMMHVTEPNKIFNYTKELLKYGFENYSMQKVIEANKVLKSTVVKDSKGSSNLDLIAASSFICALPVDKSQWNIESKENIILPVKAPVNRGDILGYIEYKRNGVSLGKVDLIASRTVEKATNEVFKDKAQSIIGNPIVCTVIILLLTSCGFILLRATLRKISRKRNKRNFRI